MSQNIVDIQNEIVDEFSMLDGDMEMTIGYIMELGEQLPKMDESLKTKDNIVKAASLKYGLMPFRKMILSDLKQTATQPSQED